MLADAVFCTLITAWYWMKLSSSRFKPQLRAMLLLMRGGGLNVSFVITYFMDSLNRYTCEKC